MDSLDSLRADLYFGLAEVLASDGPPEWLASPGHAWPLTAVVSELAPSSMAARRAITPLSKVGAESVSDRRRRHARLFAGPGRPLFWPSESAFLGGQLLSPDTFAVERVYRAAGLVIAGGELPDHASLELAFLGHLAEAGLESGLLAERRFIERHAGRWLPQLGRALARHGDEVYGPLGQLLTEWLHERSARRSLAHASPSGLPTVWQSELCNLCGFCVQSCPTRALAVQEDARETALELSVAICVGCGKCERACEGGALRMEVPAGVPASPASPGDRIVLRRSPRATCRACGAPTVSHAELDFVVVQLGWRPLWLDHCLGCRPMLWEKTL